MNNLTSDEQNYIEMINSLPRVSKSERLSLALNAQNNDSKSREKLILHYLYLIIPIATRYSNNYNISFSDAFSICTIGLINSIENFDFSYGTDFCNYALWYIKQEISRYVKTSLNYMSIPANKIGVIKDIETFYKDYIEKYDREPSVTMLSNKFNIDEKAIVLLLRLINYPLSLEDIDIVDYYLEDEIIDKLYLESIIDIINDIPDISKRDISIVYERYGILDKVPKTLEEVGKMFNLTKGRVNQIEVETLRKIRRYILVYGFNKPKVKTKNI